MKKKLLALGIFGLLLNGCINFDNVNVPTFEKTQNVNAKIQYEVSNVLPEVEIKIYSNVKIQPIISKELYVKLEQGITNYLASIQGNAHSEKTLVIKVDKIITGYSKDALDDVVLFNFFNVGADRIYTTQAEITLELENKKGQVIASKTFNVTGTAVGSAAFEEDLKVNVEKSISDFFKKLNPTIKTNIYKYITAKL